MEDHGSRPPKGSRSTRTTWAPSEQDAQAQALVLGLGLVLAEHPRQLTFAEAARALLRDDEEGELPLDSLARAIADLVSYGLLHRNGDHLVPSRAALRFDELPFP